MTRFQRATLDPFDRCWMFPWRGSVHGPPTCLCRPLFKMAEVARVQGREVLSAILSSSSFFFQILRFGFWILDFRGDENIRREIDNVERCVWRWNNWTRRIFGKILSGVWWKFGFSFFLILKFRENSKSHRVVEMLEDIWDGEWKGNDRVFFCRRMGENDDGGCGGSMVDSVFQEEYALLIGIPSSSKRSNKRNRDRILYDRWRHHVAEKEENEENEGARGRRNIFFVIIIILYITRIDA